LRREPAIQFEETQPFLNLGRADLRVGPDARLRVPTDFLFAMHDD